MYNCKLYKTTKKKQFFVFLTLILVHLLMIDKWNGWIDDWCMFVCSVFFRFYIINHHTHTHVCMCVCVYYTWYNDNNKIIIANYGDALYIHSIEDTFGYHLRAFVCVCVCVSFGHILLYYLLLWYLCALYYWTIKKNEMRKNAIKLSRECGVV